MAGLESNGRFTDPVLGQVRIGPKGRDLPRINEELKNEELQKEELKKKVILEYANHLLNTFDQADELGREKRYNQFLKTADHLIPHAKICSYFYDCEGHNTINIDGLNILFQHYNRREKYVNKFSESKAINSDSFLNELNRMEDEKFIGEKSLLVRESHGNNGKHITSVLIRKTATETRFIILDSLGSTYNRNTQGNEFYYSVEAAVDKIQKSKLPGKKVHIFSIARQVDYGSCSIFAFKDSLQNVKTNLFDAIDEFEQEGCSVKTEPHWYAPATFITDWILPQFMKMGQSANALVGYLRGNPEYSGTPVSARGTLSEVVAQYTDKSDSTGKSVNTYARKHVYKYYGIVLGEILGVPGSMSSTSPSKSSSETRESSETLSSPPAQSVDSKDLGSLETLKGSNALVSPNAPGSPKAPGSLKALGK